MYSNKTALSAIAIKGEMCYNNDVWAEYSLSFPQSFFSDRLLYALAGPELTGNNRRYEGNGRDADMDIHVGDVLELKKEHPCGSRRWLVLRVGMDFKLRCEGCGREFMIVRSKAEKNVKTIIREAES